MDRSIVTKGARRWSRGVLEHRHLAILLAVVVVLLGAPSLGGGWILDDQLHRLALADPAPYPELVRSPAKLFAFVGPGYDLPPDLVPWWLPEQFQLLFFRPLTGVTHWLDAVLWPNLPSMAHAHSLLWAALCVVAVTAAYRRFRTRGPVWIAGLSALVFTLDDSHGMPVVWIANRNVLIALLFSMLALMAHHRWRQEKGLRFAALAPLLFLLALLSAEAAVACGAYLLGYALFYDRGSPSRRFFSLLPCAAVGLSWYLTYRTLGFGALGSRIYVDPGANPLRFLGAVIERGPILLWGQLGFPSIDLFSLLSTPAARVGWILVVALGGLLCVVLLPLLRTSRAARFWAFGMILSLLPACVPQPAMRLLMFSSVGGAALFALFVSAAWNVDEQNLSLRWQRVARVLAVPLLVGHLVIAPLGLVSAGPMMATLAGLFSDAARSLPGDAATGGRAVVVVSAPSFFLSGYASIERTLTGKDTPRQLLTLCSSLHEVSVERSDSHTLVVRPGGGFLAPLGSSPPGTQSPHLHTAYVFQAFDLLFSGPEPFRPGQALEYRGVEVTVLQVTDDGRPLEVRFRFPRDLDDGSWRWMSWQKDRFADWTLPGVGQTTRIPSVFSRREGGELPYR